MADKRPITTPAALAELTNSDSLIAGASAVLSEQGSSPATPTSGYGIVYAKTDGKLYFKNDAGTETDLTATGGGGGTNPVIREYTANDTWTKPTASNFWGALVLCVGAGGGGGGGRRGLASSGRSGGGGGGGASYAYRFIKSATLTLSSYSVTVASGGLGADPQTANSTNGNNGSFGGASSFGILVAANGGSRGSGGSTGIGIAGSGGTVVTNTPAYGPFCAGGASGGSGSSTSNGSSASAGTAGSAVAGGGGAGGISTSNVQYNGGRGGSMFNGTAAEILGGAGGTIAGTLNGTAGSDVANKILFDINNLTTAAMGTGGGGGAAGDTAGTIAGGNGGTGGRGAGGGGGGGSTNGANSGAGGNGGDGLVFVVEYYGA
jgi:hypothetical protein